MYERLHTALRKHFEKHRLIFWYDTEIKTQMDARTDYRYDSMCDTKGEVTDAES